MNGSFYQMIQELQYRIMHLEQENQKLKEKVEDIKPVVIENINYKIQELNVDELKGTLNIGLTGEADLENMASEMGEDQQPGIAEENDDTSS
ncbi:MAG TPA: spore germination protein GerPC [Bacillales bacterium]|nr:spore germination protein GerPC [Bacillales bacterium]